MVKKLVRVGFAVAWLGCGSSNSTVSKDSGADVGLDAPAKPDTNGNDVPDTYANDSINPADNADVPRDRAPGEPIPPDAPAGEVPSNVGDTSLDIGDAPVDAQEAPAPDGPSEATDLTKPDVLGADADRGEARSDGTDGTSVSERGDTCTCAEGFDASIVPWSCFCSVESCARTLGDFVGVGDGGKVLKSGQGTLLLTEYAGCNLVLVQAQTYSDYVPASQYVFDRTTGTLVGARILLDDRQHACPFASSDARWVFGYQSGSFPIPTSCQATDCLAGTGTCPGSADAR